MNETSTQRRAWHPPRHDRAADALHAPSNLPATAELRPNSGRVWGMVGLVVLTGATSLVVATISIWLVPVYMTAMVLIFAAPRSNRPVEPTSPPEAADDSATASPEAVAGSAEEQGGTAVIAEPTAQASDATEPPTPKPRKKRGKGKRGAKAAALAEASSSQPTWIRVGPGKFVRADVQAESSAEPENPTESPDAPPADLESTPEREADDPVTTTEEAPTESVEEYGNAPSTLDGRFDEEHGNAPSALDETWEPEPLPEAVADDDPEPDDEDEDDRREDVVDEDGFQQKPGTPAAHAGPSPMIAPKIPGRSAPLGISTASRVFARPADRETIRRPSPPGDDRPGLPRSPGPRGVTARSTGFGRSVRVRPRNSDRGRRKSDATGRRPHPRSPPRRA